MGYTHLMYRQQSKLKSSSAYIFTFLFRNTSVRFFDESALWFKNVFLYS